MSFEGCLHHRLGLLAPLLLTALACADFSRGPAVDAAETVADAGATGDGGALGFAADIYPLLTTCMNCHVPGGQASASALIFSGNAATDYKTVLQFVDTAAPASSRLLSKVSGNGHGGGTVYAVGTAQYDTILAWIQQGARP
jgi:mono/diheme cytochrome c family protein